MWRAAYSRYSSAIRTCRTSSQFWVSKSFPTKTARLWLGRARSALPHAALFSLRKCFTGSPGRFVPIRETVRGFREILDGQHDELPEQAFYMVGTIDEVVERAEQMAAVN